MGIEPSHWPLIRQVSGSLKIMHCGFEIGPSWITAGRLNAQVSMQAHDLAGRLDRLEALLRRAGFQHVSRWQEPRFRGCSLWMIYASRTDGITRSRGDCPEPVFQEASIAHEHED
jgi:hypothetical protein